MKLKIISLFLSVVFLLATTQSVGTAQVTNPPIKPSTELSTSKGLGPTIFFLTVAAIGIGLTIYVTKKYETSQQVHALVLIKTTNITLPKAQWERVATNWTRLAVGQAWPVFEDITIQSTGAFFDIIEDQSIIGPPNQQ